jgi:hypothetical protein
MIPPSSHHREAVLLEMSDKVKDFATLHQLHGMLSLSLKIM